MVNLTIKDKVEANTVILEVLAVENIFKITNNGN